MTDEIGKLSYDCLNSVAKIFKETELKVLEVEKDTSIINPIQSDLVNSIRNMGYEEIRIETQGFIKRIKEIKKAINEEK